LFPRQAGALSLYINNVLNSTHYTFIVKGDYSEIEFVNTNFLFTAPFVLNPFQTEGPLCPHWLWMFITFLISKLKPPNLVIFPKNYLETILHSNSKCLSNKMNITIATTFWPALFSEFWVFTFSMEYYNVLQARFTFYCDFRIRLLVLITFWSILVIFKGQEIQDGRSKMAAFWDPNVILPSYDVTNLLRTSFLDLLSAL